MGRIYPRIRIDEDATAAVWQQAQRFVDDSVLRDAALRQVTQNYVIDGCGAWTSVASRDSYYQRGGRMAPSDRLADLYASGIGEHGVDSLIRALEFLGLCVVPATAYSRRKAQQCSSYGWKHEAESGKHFDGKRAYVSNGQFIAVCLMCGVGVVWNFSYGSPNHACCIVAPLPCPA